MSREEFSDFLAENRLVQTHIGLVLKAPNQSDIEAVFVRAHRGDLETGHFLVTPLHASDIKPNWECEGTAVESIEQLFDDVEEEDIVLLECRWATWGVTTAMKHVRGGCLVRRPENKTESDIWRPHPEGMARIVLRGLDGKPVKTAQLPRWMAYRGNSQVESTHWHQDAGALLKRTNISDYMMDVDLLEWAVRWNRRRASQHRGCDAPLDVAPGLLERVQKAVPFEQRPFKNWSIADKNLSGEAVGTMYLEKTKRDVEKVFAAEGEDVYDDDEFTARTLRIPSMGEVFFF